MLYLLMSLALASETRETYDGHGRVLTHQVLDGSTVAEDVRYAYDKDGNLIEKVTVTFAGGARIEEKLTQTWEDGLRTEAIVVRTEAGATTTKRDTWVYDKKGRETEHIAYTNGEIVRTEETTWEDGHKIAQTVTDNGVTTRSTWTWDVDGKLHASEVKDGDGNVTSAYQAQYERPYVPIDMSIGGGIGYQTDVDLLSINGSFSIARKPQIRRFGSDPLEIGASVSYAYGRSRGAVVNNALNAHFGLDLNLVAPRTTPFLFIDFDRNPAFNQNADLEVAPVGVKFDLVPREIMKLDFSFAPILNFRSILIPTGGTLPTPDGDVVVDSDTNFDTLKLRGSFRFRLGYSGKGWDISDTIEYLPTLWANDGLGLSFAERLTQDSIARNTFSFSFGLTPWMKLSESFFVNWDPTLSLQAGCDGTTDSLLCDGVVLQNTTSLVFTWQVKR